MVVASFAATTTDSTYRLQSYVAQEIFSGFQRKRASPVWTCLSNPHCASGKLVWFLIPPTLLMIAMPLVAMVIHLFVGNG